MTDNSPETPRSLLPPYLKRFPETNQLNVAGVGSTLPDVSTALTWKTWVPLGRLMKLAGLAQALNAALSRLQAKPLTATLSLPVKVNLIADELILAPLAIGLPLPSTAAVIVVSGGTVSVGGVS